MKVPEPIEYTHPKKEILHAQHLSERLYELLAQILSLYSHLAEMEHRDALRERIWEPSVSSLISDLETMSQISRLETLELEFGIKIPLDESAHRLSEKLYSRLRRLKPTLATSSAKYAAILILVEKQLLKILNRMVEVDKVDGPIFFTLGESAVQRTKRTKEGFDYVMAERESFSRIDPKIFEGLS